MRTSDSRYKAAVESLESVKEEAENKQAMVASGTYDTVQSEKAILILKLLAHYGDKIDEAGMAKLGGKLTLKEYCEWTDLAEADRILKEKKEAAAAQGLLLKASRKAD